jgi:type VI secretion system protein ImpL
VELARLMASPNSTLKQFMKEISEETTLVGQTERVAQAIGDRVTERINRKANMIPRDVLKKSMDKEVSDSLIEQRVDEHFFAIHRLFLDKNAGYAEIEALFNRLYTQLSAVLAAQRGKTLAPDPAVFLEIQSQAGLLPEPMRSMITQLGTRASEQNESTRKSQLSTELTPSLDMCRRMTEGRYPFYAQANLDVLPEDFVRLFSRQGLMNELQNTQLQNNQLGKALWNPDAQSNLDRAKRIQEAFLANGNKAGFSVEVRLINSSNPNDTFYWEQDGKLLMFSQQFDPKHVVNWNLNSGNGDLKLRSSDDSNSVTYKGPWSLFRFLDAGQIQLGSGPERFQFTYRLNGKVFEFEMISQSTLNPLRLSDLKLFKCPRVS